MDMALAPEEANVASDLEKLCRITGDISAETLRRYVALGEALGVVLIRLSIRRPGGTKRTPVLPPVHRPSRAAPPESQIGRQPFLGALLPI